MSILAVSALGDALGAPYEFNENILKSGQDASLVKYGSRHWLDNRGEWTDDTYMALCIARAMQFSDLRSDEGLNVLTKFFILWASEYPAGIGIQTSKLLDGLSMNTSASELMSYSLRYFMDNPNDSAGNGSLMRVHPLSLLPYSRGEIADVSRNVTRLTHADPRCIDASIMWVEMLRKARVNGDFDPYAGLDLIDSSNYDFWKKTIDEALNSHSSDFSYRGWWVIPTYQQALSAVNSNISILMTNPIEIFNEIIRAKDGDSDTVCAIAGGLMGALGVKIDDFDPDMINVVHGEWPEHLTLSNLLTIESMLLRGQ